MAKKKITLEDLAVNQTGLTKTVEKLAQEMRGGFVGVDVKIKESEKRIVKEIEIKIDELAAITKRGFDSVDERFEKLEGTNTREHEEINTRLDNLEKSNTREHEEMSLKLDDVAYRFELVALQKRVEVLEKKAGVARKNF